MAKALKKIAFYKLVFLSVLGLSLLLSYIPDQAWQPADETTASKNLHVIEFSDDGELLDPNQLQALRQRISSADRAPELVIFVHGWHHNAKTTDDNFVTFQRFFAEMAKSDAERNLIGLYIGWRGDKYDPFWLDGSNDADSWIEPLDFPTIFQRKAVARHIGSTGFSQLLDQFDLLEQQGALQRYTVIGHSLGGAVALHGSKERVRQSILKQQENKNLFILLNPAVTTSEYQPLDQLLSIDRQKPAMVVLQSKGDFALKEAFGWIKDGQRAMGASWAITHDIDRCSGGDCSKNYLIPKRLQAYDAKPGCMMELNQSGWKIRARLNARRTMQTCGDANMQAVWVLAVSDDIIFGHNGILTHEHATALSEVMALIDRYNNKLPADSAQQSTETLQAVQAQQRGELPLVTDGSTTDSDNTESPAHEEAAPTEPVQATPVPAESAQGESVQGESVPSEPVKGETVPADSVPMEALPAEPVSATPEPVLDNTTAPRSQKPSSEKSSSETLNSATQAQPSATVQAPETQPSKPAIPAGQQPATGQR